MTQKSHYLAYTMRKPYFKDTCTPIFVAALFRIGRTWKPPKCPSTEEWIKMWYKYTVEFYSAIIRNELPFAATYLKTKNATNELIYNIQIGWDFKNKLMITKGREGYIRSLGLTYTHLLFSSKLCPALFVTPWTIAHTAPLSLGFPRQEYWSGLPFPSPGDLPNPGIKPESSALAGK